jgi:hypothetical protein
MFYRLQMHPDSVCPSVSRIDVQVTRRAEQFSLRYAVSGSISLLKLPAPAAPERADQLWQHTCCEAFLGSMNDTRYCEFNFSPSTQWAAYRFANYREGMQMAIERDPPRIELQTEPRCLQLSVDLSVPSSLLTGVDFVATTLRLGLSAVIEEMSGSKSYWALAHAPGKPDFHHACSFVEMADSTS